jgi:hypothetical protein
MNEPFEHDLDPIVRRLETERPVPRAAFRGELGRELRARMDATPARPHRLRLLIATYAGSGTFLLAVAAVGLAGVGPLSAG